MMLREISRSCEGDGHPNVKLTFKMESKGEVLMEINRRWVRRWLCTTST